MRGLRFICFVLWLPFFALSSSATEQRKPIPISPADESKDTICFYGSEMPDSWKTFFRKFDDVLACKGESLNIIHIGGSHVQGGMLTGRLRDNLLSLRPGIEGSFGLVFPFAAARTNTPSFYKSRSSGNWDAEKNVQKNLSKRLGLMGMAVTATGLNSSVSLVSKVREDLGYSPGFNQVQVCGYPAVYARDSVSICPSVSLSDGRVIGPESVPEDSLFKFYLPRITDSVSIACPLGFTLTGVRLLNYYPGITVSAAGVNGASLSSWASCVDLARDIERENPDLVILAIGVNDASGSSFDPEVFKERYNALLKMILEFNPDCAVLFVTNNDTCRRVKTGRRSYSYKSNTNGPIVRKAFHELASTWNAGVWDLFDIMGGLGSIEKWQKAGLARRDKVHFTAEGYSLLGDLVFNALMESYVKYKEESR